MVVPRVHQAGRANHKPDEEVIIGADGEIRRIVEHQASIGTADLLIDRVDSFHREVRRGSESGAATAISTNARSDFEQEYVDQVRCVGRYRHCFIFLSQATTANATNENISLWVSVGM